MKKIKIESYWRRPTRWPKTDETILFYLNDNSCDIGMLAWDAEAHVVGVWLSSDPDGAQNIPWQTYRKGVFRYAYLHDVLNNLVHYHWSLHENKNCAQRH